MPLPLVQRNAGVVTTGDSASLTGTFASTPTQGNLLVCCACSDATLTMSSTGWSLAQSAVNACGLYQWWKIAGASESTSVTVAPSISDSVSMMIEEWSGNTASPLDKTAVSAVQATTTTPVTGTTATTTQADELAIGCIGTNFPNGSSDSYSAWANSFVETNDAQTTGSAAECSLGVAELALSVTGAQSTSPTATLSRSTYSGLIGTYMPLPPVFFPTANVNRRGALIKARAR